jgi:hypothetical protein
MWAVWALWHIFAACFLRIGAWQVLAVVLAIDFIFIFPEAYQFRYDIEHRQFTIKRRLYPDISFPCASIVAVENATLFTMRGGFRSAAVTDLKIYSESFGAYRITYTINPNSPGGQRKSVIVCPKDREAFLEELKINVDPRVILINNTESAFKKKKNEQ